MDQKIDVKTLISEIKKKWILIVVFILIGAVVLDLYGYAKAKESTAGKQSLHERYAEAAPELPGYYTEKLYAIRESLTDAEAEQVLAYAAVYQDFVSKYGKEIPEEDSENLIAYMVLMDSLKDVKSMLNSNQREFFNIMKTIDREEYAGTSATVEEYTPAAPGIIQVKYAVLGAAAGLFVSLFIVAVPVLVKKYRVI